MKDTKEWVEYRSDAVRLVFICMIRQKSSLEHTLSVVRGFTGAYISASLNVNSFVGASKDVARKAAVEMLDSFEAMVHAVPPVESMEFCRKLVIFRLAAFGDVKLARVYTRALAICYSIQNFVSHDALGPITTSIEFLRTCVRRVSDSDKFEPSSSDDAALTSEINANNRWAAGWPLPVVLEFERLINPAFRFNVPSETMDPTTDAYNRTSKVLIDIIKNELEANAHATDAINVWNTLIEISTKKIAAMLRKNFNPSPKRHNEMRSWDDAVAFLDAVVADMQRVCNGAEGMWAKARESVVQKRPNAIDAFIHGLDSLWNIQRSMNIFVINRALLAPRTTFQSSRMISNSLNDRMNAFTVFMFNITSALEEVAAQYPGLMKQVCEKKKGALFSFTGVLVVHVMFRRNKELDPVYCPPTLTLEGPRLVALQKKAHRFSDAAIILDSCLESEREPAATYIRSFTGSELLPMFVPMLSPETVDRAAHRGKNKRTEFERGLVKFLALAAMQMAGKTLADTLTGLQPLADEIVRELRVLIKVNRCIHYKLYGKLIKKLCDAIMG